MKACSKCGTSNADHANFCQACRSPLQVVSASGQTSGRTVKSNSKFCQTCGASVQPQDKYCEKCGTQLANQVTAVVHSHGETRQGTEISQDDLIVFVGNNQAYYLQKWMTSLQPEKRSGWNWVAFFFAPMWFAYRKMYLQAFIFFIVQSIVSSITFGITGLAGAIIGGLFGNAYYYKHAKQKIQQTMLSTDNPDMRKMKLMQAGGTSKGALILVIVLWLLWSTLTTLAGMPA